MTQEANKIAQDATHPFTDQEAEIFTMLRAIGDGFMQLEGQHPALAMEAGMHVRQLQSSLILRAFRRQYPHTFKSPNT